MDFLKHFFTWEGLHIHRSNAVGGVSSGPIKGATQSSSNSSPWNQPNVKWEKTKHCELPSVQHKCVYFQGVKEQANVYSTMFNCNLLFKKAWDRTIPVQIGSFFT